MGRVARDCLNFHYVDKAALAMQSCRQLIIEQHAQPIQLEELNEFSGSVSATTRSIRVLLP